LSEIKIEISPFNCNFWFISLESSYRFGVETGIIYTFRLFNRAECDKIENKPNFYKYIAKSLDHECLHKTLLDIEGYETCKKFDNVAKSPDNKEYLI
jgi:hypothetical protein